MANTGLKECFEPLNQSLNGLVNLFINPSVTNDNTFVQIPLADTSNKKSFTLSALYYIQRNSNDVSEYEVFPFGFRLSLYKTFYLIGQTQPDEEPTSIICIDSDGRRIVLEKDTSVAIEGLAVYTNLNESFFVVYHESGSFDEHVSFHYSNDVFYRYKVGEHYPFKYETDVSGPASRFTLTLSNHKPATLTLNNNYRLQFIYNAGTGYLATILIQYIDETQTFPTYVTKETVAFLYNTSDYKFVITRYSGALNDNNVLSNLEIEMLVDDCEYISIKDLILNEKIVIDLDSNQRCSEIISYKGTSSQSVTLTYSSSLNNICHTTITDQYGKSSYIYYDANRLPLHYFHESGALKAFYYDANTRLLTSESPAISLLMYNRTSESSDLVTNGFFVNGSTGWTYNGSGDTYWNPIFNGALTSYKVIIDSKISQTINYTGLPEENLTFVCGIEGASGASGQNVKGYAKVSLYDYDAQLVDSRKVETRYYHSDSVFEFIFFDITPYKSYTRIEIEIGSDHTNINWMIGSIQLIKNTASKEITYSHDLKPSYIKSRIDEAVNVYDTNRRLVFSSNENGSSFYYDYYTNSQTLFTKKESDYDYLEEITYGNEEEHVFSQNNNVLTTNTYIYENNVVVEELVDDITVKYNTYNSYQNLSNEEDILSGLSVNYIFKYGSDGPLEEIHYTDYDDYLDEITYTYNNKNLTSNIEEENVSYSYNYDSNTNLLTSISIGNSTFISYSYDSYLRLTGKSYSSNDYFTYVYNSDNQISEVKHLTNTLFTVTYDEFNRIKTIDNYSFTYLGDDIKQISYGDFLIEYKKNSTSSFTTFNSYGSGNKFFSNYMSSNQSLYNSKLSYLSSVFAFKDISFLIANVNYKIPNTLSSDSTNFTLIGASPISAINYDSTSKAYSFSNDGSYVITSKTSNKKPLTYRWITTNNKNIKGQTIGGYFKFNTLPNTGYTLENVVFSFYNALTDKYIALYVGSDGYLKIKNNFGMNVNLPLLVSTNSWCYISMTVDFDIQGYMASAVIRLNDTISTINNLASSDVFINLNEANQLFYISFLGCNSEAFPLSEASNIRPPSDAYSKALFLSSYDVCLSKDDEKLLYGNTINYLADNSTNNKSTSASLFLKDSSNTDVKIFPLNNSFESLDGTRPVLLEKDYSLNTFNDYSFRFNTANNQYSYYACGYPLIYKFPFVTSGSISLNVVLDSGVSSSTSRYLFDMRLSSTQISLRLLTNQLRLKVGSSNYSYIGLSSNVNNKITLIWEVESTSTQITLKTDYYTFQETVPLVLSGSEFELYIGRRKTTNASNDPYPLLGYIDSLAVSLDDSVHADTVYPALGVVNKSITDDINNKSIIENVGYLDSTNYNHHTSIHTFDYSTDTSKQIFTNYIKNEDLQIGSSTHYYRLYFHDYVGRVTGYTNSNASMPLPTDPKTVEFSYDVFSRLTTYKKGNDTYSYIYDVNGNITSIKLNGTTIKSFTYDYLNRLTSFGGNNVSYSSDVITNLTSYTDTDGKTVELTYQGRRLTTYKKKSNMQQQFAIPYTYSYDYKSRRITKSSRFETFTYFYDGNNLVYERRGTLFALLHELRYFYDENGKLSYLTLDGVKYFYYIDALGVINGLYDENGAMVVQYSYNPWGEVTVTSDTSGVSLSTLNPFRYKSYYYDEESGYYYCLTRYYYPKIMRWINGDDPSYLTESVPNGYNLFTYCNNNPVMLEDREGTFFTIGLTSLITGFAFQLYCSICSYALIAFSSLLDEKIRNDMNDIGWNIFNPDVSKVLKSTEVSFYKGIPVFRIKGNRSGTFGAIFLAQNESSSTVLHEYGHIFQQLFLGPIDYFAWVFLPSACESSVRDEYYTRPYETIASVIGGDFKNEYGKNDFINSFIHLIIAGYFGPLSYLFALW